LSLFLFGHICLFKKWSGYRISKHVFIKLINNCTYSCLTT
jgi:hypothetical protein